MRCGSVDDDDDDTQPPLGVMPNRSRAQRRRNFFGELLPEGRVLTRLATARGSRACWA